MRVADAPRAFGAVIGKALTPLREGTGLVEMVIGLHRWPAPSRSWAA